MRGKHVKIAMAIIISVSLLFMHIPGGTHSWSNGGYSEDPSNPDYGTHDWIAEHALDYLPEDEKGYILNNLSAYLYGTELPDNGGAPDGIGDTSLHHVYYYSNGTLQDDASAVRASEVYQNALSYLRNNDTDNASKWAGIMSHYLVDVAVFGHVMGAYTDWGAEDHHSDYETYVTNRMTSYTSATFDPYLSFDGTLRNETAYNLTLELANFTTFGDGGYVKNCTWMDNNYNWSDTTFKDSCGHSLNYAVNYLADLLHRLAVESKYNGTADETSQDHTIYITEVYYDVAGSDTDGEYIELFNPTYDDADIINWNMSDGEGDYVFTESTVIPAYTFFTISRNSTFFYNEFGKYPDRGDLSLSLSNSGDHVTLYNDTGGEEDMVAWEGELGWSLTANEGEVLLREDECVDTDTEDDWIVSSPDPQVVEDGQFTPDSSDSLYMETGGPSEGWHFVSFMVHPYNTSISYLLDNESGGIPGSYDKVMYYSAGSDEWMTYLPYRDTHYNDLHTWNNSMGLWIHMISNDTLYVNGTTPTTTDITLYPGWNMVGYPSEVGSTLPSEVSKIGVYEPENEYNLQYIYDLENYTLGAYNGYWVYNSADHNVVWSVEYLG